MREWENRRAGTERRWEEETGKEGESDRKKVIAKGRGGAAAGAEAESSELQSQGQPAGKGKGVQGLLGPKTLGPGPHVDNGLMGPGSGRRFQWEG